MRNIKDVIKNQPHLHNSILNVPNIKNTIVSK